MKLLDLNTLREKTAKRVLLPALSALEGEPVGVTIRRVAFIEYWTLIPPAPAESADWPAAEFRQRELAWLEALPVEIQQRRREQMLQAQYELIARAAIEPPLTPDQVRLLGNDAPALFQAIMEHSGLLGTTATNGASDAGVSTAEAVSAP